MIKEKYIITGMTCSACSSRVQRAAESIDGMELAQVNLLTGTMLAEYDESKTDSSHIIAAVEKSGYGAALAGKNAEGSEKAVEDNKKREKEAADKKRCLVWSIMLMLPLAAISMGGMLFNMGYISHDGILGAYMYGTENAITFSLSQLLLVLPVMALNSGYYSRGFKSLFNGAPNMDSLVAMSSFAAAFFGIFAIFRIGYGLGHGDLQLAMEYSSNLYLESAGMIVTFVSVGKYLESKAKAGTGEALAKLMSMVPKDAKVLRDGVEYQVPAEDLREGDIAVVRPGECIPADGVIISGNTAIDENIITGESMPVEKGPGDEVISSTINQSGFIHFRVGRVGEEMVISQIIHMVDDAVSSKAPIARMADKVAGVFVPAVMALALIAGGCWLLAGASAEFAFSTAISVLVISCPCALGLATPVALMAGIGKGAEHGIIIKSGEALEAASTIDTVVLDKTGTLTEGKPCVTDAIPIGVTETRLAAVAASLEKGSEHPIARAVLKWAEDKNASYEDMVDFQAIFGRGVTGIINNERYYAGNRELLDENNIEYGEASLQADQLADEGKTAMLIADSRKVMGIIAVADMEKPASAEAVKALQAMGISVVMLTGDNERTAGAVAKHLDIDCYIAGVRPDEKLQHIQKLQEDGHSVAMVGDGVNDAPALVQSDFGAAIGAGSDVAIGSADAVLIRNSLLDAVASIRLSRAVIRNIKENLFWAFFYNIICIPMAAGVFYPAFGLKLSPMMGAAAMSLSSICVVMNALRLKRVKLSGDAVKKPAATMIYKNNEEEIIMQTELKIDGMMCQHCVKHVHDALIKVENVTEVNVDLAGKKAVVTTSAPVEMAVFENVITEAGYTLIK